MGIEQAIEKVMEGYTAAYGNIVRKFQGRLRALA